MSSQCVLICYICVDMSQTEFLVGLMGLVMEKMAHDLPELLHDDHQFSHLVDEALMFDREVRASYGYPASLPGCLHLLAEPEYFSKWLAIERKCEHGFSMFCCCCKLFYCYNTRKKTI